MNLLRWLTFLLRSLTVTVIVLLLWSAMAIPPLGNSDHVVVSVSIDFPSNSKQDALFHCIACYYSCADWDGLQYHLRDVPWEDV